MKIKRAFFLRMMIVIGNLLLASVSWGQNSNASYFVNSDGSAIFGIAAKADTDIVSSLSERMVKQSSGLNNASLIGIYLNIWQALDLNLTSTEVWSGTSIIIFDGAGSCTVVGTLEQGVRRVDDVTPRTIDLFNGIPDNGICTYSLASDGALTLNGNATYFVDPGTNIITGITTSPPAPALTEIMVKQSSGLTNASLIGTFLNTWQSKELTATSTEVWSGTNAVTFDGAGNCSFAGALEQGVRRVDDVTPRTIDLFSGTPDNGICTYSLASDGVLTIDGESSYAFNPIVNTIVGIISVEDPGITVSAITQIMVKQSVSLSDASLLGTYRDVWQSTELTPTSTEVWSGANNLNFDGAGNCSFTGTLEEGSIRTDDIAPRTLTYFIGEPDVGSCFYSLASDGALTISTVYSENIPALPFAGAWIMSILLFCIVRLVTYKKEQ